MNIKALERIIRILEAPLPKKVGKFTLNSWWQVTTKDGHHCGTTACACGLAAQDPWFRKQGWRLIPPADLGPYHTRNGEARHEYKIMISHGCFLSTDLASFFDIPFNTFNYLFLPDAYKRGSRRDVIYRIRSVIARFKKDKAYLYEGGFTRRLSDDIRPHY